MVQFALMIIRYKITIIAKLSWIVDMSFDGMGEEKKNAGAQLTRSALLSVHRIFQQTWNEDE